jgi:hypothetical protein
MRFPAKCFLEKMMRFPLTLAVATMVGLAAAPSRADQDEGVGKVRIGVPSAVTPIANTAQPSLLDPEYASRVVASATDPVENPSGVITMFGKLATGAGTEPDQNLYLKMPTNPGGPTPGFDYGRHFLFQGHENAGNLAHVTRINLDVSDRAHRVTLLTPVNPTTGLTNFNAIDGSTFNPFTNTLLFTQETSASNNGTGAVIQITPNWPPVVNTLEAFLGLGGYEGIHPDDKGTLYFAEDIGGSSAPAGTLATIDGTPNVALRNARQPNSFMYRYVPNNPRRIEDGGKLQALQVIIDGRPVTFGGTSRDQIIADITSPAQLKLHTPGTSFPIKWVTIHESHAGDTAAFVATTAAKAAGATPFKRPENLAWLPGSNFRTFFFCPTGDTDAPSSQIPQLAARGSWGSIFRIDLKEDDGRDGRFDVHEFLDDLRDQLHDRNKQAQDDKRQEPKNDGKISIFVLGDQVHNSFDNLSFANEHQILATEDRGDGLHDQLTTLDSIWAFDTRVQNGRPVRFVALGRDSIASTPGAEDNEPTGAFVSNGAINKNALMGTEQNLDNARGFFTAQHGDNSVFEIFNVRR